jgi:hypothetical protein
MATIDKNFKIKNGLVVEGTTATVDGNQVLTENASDQYILDLIGGETLVKSVSGNLSVDGSGNLTINENGLTDDITANSNYIYDDGDGTLMLDTEGLEDAGFVTATGTKVLTNKTINDELYFTNPSTQANDGGIKIDDSNEDLVIRAYTADLEVIALGDVNVTSNNGNINLNPDGNVFINGSTAAEQVATQGYVDGEISSLSTSDIEEGTNLYFTNQRALDATNAAYDASGAASQALSDANDYTDTAVGNIVGAAPEILDTLQELATALQDNPDIISDLQDIAAGKQDTLTAGNGIDLTDNIAAINAGSGLDFDGGQLIVDTGLIATRTYAEGLGSNYDAAGAASTAESNANSYTDTAIGELTTSDIPEGTNLYFTDYAAKTSAVDLLVNATKENIAITWSNPTGLVITAENGVDDSTTDNLDEGTSNLYFTDQRVRDAISTSTEISPVAIDINTYRREEATQQWVENASTVTAHTFTGNRSVKYLVRTVGNVLGTLHSQITELLVTVDGGNNIAVTEYGTIHTSENPLATATMDYAGGEYRLRVTTAIAGAEVVAAATILNWAD